MICLEELQFVGGRSFSPRHDPELGGFPTPSSGLRVPGLPVYYLSSSVVVVGVEDRPPLGDLGCAQRHRPALLWVAL